MSHHSNKSSRLTKRTLELPTRSKLGWSFDKLIMIRCQLPMTVNNASDLDHYRLHDRNHNLIFSLPFKWNYWSISEKNWATSTEKKTYFPSKYNVTQLSSANILIWRKLRSWIFRKWYIVIIIVIILLMIRRCPIPGLRVHCANLAARTPCLPQV